MQYVNLQWYWICVMTKNVSRASEFVKRNILFLAPLGTKCSWMSGVSRLSSTINIWSFKDSFSITTYSNLAMVLLGRSKEIIPCSWALAAKATEYFFFYWLSWCKEIFRYIITIEARLQLMTKLIRWLWWSSIALLSTSVLILKNHKLLNLEIRLVGHDKSQYHIKVRADFKSCSYTI